MHLFIGVHIGFIPDGKGTEVVAALYPDIPYQGVEIAESCIMPGKNHHPVGGVVPVLNPDDT